MSDSDPMSDIAATVRFFEKAYPSPGSKNFHTQLGVHFEEIAEMMEALVGLDSVADARLAGAYVQLLSLSKWLKQNDNVVRVGNREEFLDGLCDQVVTATGVAHMAGLDIEGGFSEVNRSNFSKFDENGNPILDSNLKMVKGPHYFKPNLTPFLEKASAYPG